MNQLTMNSIGIVARGVRTTSTFSAVVAVGLSAICMLSMTHDCHGQASGTFGGNRNLGGGTLSPRQNNFGGQGAFGGGGGMGMGSGQSSAMGGMSALQGAGQLTGNERFVRSSRQPGQFVGADSADARNIYSQSGMGNTGQFGQSNQFGMNQLGMSQFGMQNQFGLQGQMRNGTNRSTRQTGQRGRQTGGQFGMQGRQMQQNALPRRLSASLIAATVPTPVLDNALEQRVTRMERPTIGASSETRARRPAINPSSSVQVTVQGQTAILRGTVTSEYERELVARMARLEPGIWAVQNELTIASPSEGSNAESLPPPAQP